MDLQTILYGWPYFGLVMCAGLIAFLDWDRRRHDETFTSGATALGFLWPIYLLHQFEEHGIDVLGRRFHFIEDLCAVFGKTVEACAADPEFIFAVNPGTCWIAFGLALAYRRRNPSVAVAAWGIPAINCLAHFSPFLRSGEYNSGLITCVALFVPSIAWVLVACSRTGYSRARTTTLMLLSGIVVHVVLIASLVFRDLGALGRLPLYTINVLNGLVPLAIALLWPGVTGPRVGGG